MKADLCRVFGATKMNVNSSRSHVLVMLKVTKRAALGIDASPTSILKARVGKLYLVDLAGSERLKKSLSTGEGIPSIHPPRNR